MTLMVSVNEAPNALFMQSSILVDHLSYFAWKCYNHLGFINIDQYYFGSCKCNEKF